MTFAITSTEPDSAFVCAVDALPLAACSATVQLDGLSSGEHTFRAAAVDAADNQDETPVEYTWTVASDDLDTTLTVVPNAVTGSDVTFEFAARRPGTFECLLAPTDAAYPSAMSYLDLPEIAGGYVFHVRAIDTAGNVDDTPASKAQPDLASPRHRHVWQPWRHHDLYVEHHADERDDLSDPYDAQRGGSASRVRA